MAEAQLINKEQIAPQHFLCAFRFQSALGELRPGQFFNLKVSPGTDPLLRRPMSFVRQLDARTVSIFIQVVGRGTEALASLHIGDAIDILGPFGNGFELKKEKTIALVAGGVGIAPLALLAENARKKNMTVHFFLGARTDEQLQIRTVLGDVEKKVQMHFSTDDGSFGFKGFVSKLLAHSLKEIKADKIFCCGPNAMMASTATVARTAVLPIDASLESRMACGFGTCMGCVVNLADGRRFRVCKEGPVVDGLAVDWAALNG